MRSLGSQPIPLWLSHSASFSVAAAEALFSYQTVGCESRLTLSHHEILMSLLLCREAAITTHNHCGTGGKVCSSPPDCLVYLLCAGFVSLSAEFCLTCVRTLIWREHQHQKHPPFCALTPASSSLKVYLECYTALLRI